MNNKWKIFAIQQFFSHDPTSGEAVDLWDALDRALSAAEVMAIEENTIRWEFYEGVFTPEFRSLVVDTARICQQIENESTPYIWAWINEKNELIEVSAFETTRHNVPLFRRNGANHEPY